MVSEGEKSREQLFLRQHRLAVNDESAILDSYAHVYRLARLGDGELRRTHFLELANVLLCTQ